MPKDTSWCFKLTAFLLLSMVQVSFVALEPWHGNCFFSNLSKAPHANRIAPFTQPMRRRKP